MAGGMCILFRNSKFILHKINKISRDIEDRGDQYEDYADH